MFKKVLVSFSLAAALAACGPSQQPAPGEPAQQPPAAVAPAPAPAAPSAADQELAKLKAENRKLEREQKQLAAAQAQAAATPPPAPVCQDCGVIASITPVKKAGEAGWAGTLGGAAAGGLAGNQFGKGKGKTAMTVVGVLGGALAGREVEKQVTSSTAYQVVVNMEAGGQRSVTVASAEGLAQGTRVHVNGNSVQPY
ncbi:MAG TPA: glycine zipper 2TM domain-containing protein [Nevskia sp.]|nr:glycine zipper 2TM domain-containing protein [Nevskia sp.]